MYSQTQSLLVIDLFNHFAQNLINILAKTYEDLKLHMFANTSLVNK